MPSRQLPHYWTPEQVRRILAAMLAGQPWLLALLIWYPALRQAKAGRGGLVPPHPELVDAFRSVSRGRPDDRVFQLSAWLGHSSPTVTLNTYLVLAPDTLCAISEVL